MFLGRQDNMNGEDSEVSGDGLEKLVDHLKKVVAEIFADPECDEKDKVVKFKHALRLLTDEDVNDDEEEEEESVDDEEEPGEPKEEPKRESLQCLAKRNKDVRLLLERVDTLEAKLSVQERAEMAKRLCEEAHLPALAVTEFFMSRLLELADEKAMKSMIEDRKSITNVRRPTSAASTGKRTVDTKTVASIFRSN